MWYQRESERAVRFEKLDHDGASCSIDHREEKCDFMFRRNKAKENCSMTSSVLLN
jgi:hypothetical protein